MKVTGTVISGKFILDIDEQKRFDKYLARVPDFTLMDMEFHAPIASRSPNQNRYYYGIVIKMLTDHTGIERDDMHEVCKHLFLSQKVRMSFDKRKKIETTKSTKELTTKEFEDYLLSIRSWAWLKLGCRIPTPNEAPIFDYN